MNAEPEFEPQLSSELLFSECPAHWKIKRLKWSITGVFNGIWGNDPAGIDDITCVRVADFDRLTNSVIKNPPTSRSVDSKFLENRKLKAGDLLIEKSGGGDKQLVGCVVSFDHDFDAVCSNFVARMQIAERMHSRFWTYCHAALYAARLNFSAIKQTTGIQNIDTETYLDIKVAFPPLSEQKAIANYLDQETAQIDFLISEKEQMLALLEEKQAALISQAVTRGLNPDVEFVPSGLDWLGEIPKAWNILPIKYVASVGNGSTPSVDKTEYWNEQGFPWLNSSIANLEYVGEPPRRVSELALQECHLPRINPPAVLIGITGQGKTRGMVTILNYEATINQHLAFIKTDSSKLDVEFIRFVLGCAYSYLRSDSDGAGSTKGAITCEQIANFQIPVPTLDEQKEIVNYIKTETASISEVMGATQHSVELLKERRAALITAAVTGQINPEEMAT